MDWALLIQMLIEMIQESLENRSRDSIEARLARPRFAEAVLLRRLLKEQGLKGKELHKEMRAGLAYLKNMDAEEREALIDEAVAGMKTNSA